MTLARCLARLLAPLPLVLAIAAYTPSWADNRQTLLKGSWEIPFPDFKPLDYNIARVCAWLEALQGAGRLLPKNAVALLWDWDCDTEAGRMALASLLFPIQTVTPDISHSRGVDLFLTEPKDPSRLAMKILDAPELYFIQLSLLLEMKRILETLREIRPQTSLELKKLAGRIDPLSAALEQIWKISRALQNESDEGKAASRIESENSQLLLPVIWECEQKLAEDKNQVALALAEKALQMYEGADYDSDPPVLKKYLMGRILRLRGLALWRQRHPALAEADLNRAASMLRETGIRLDLLGDTYLDLGGVKKDRRDSTGMCAAYRDACALGRCGPLAEFRRQGVCREKSRP